ncbi:hypothetical protein [Aestuariivirga sp.]|jgi:hypothetical protein|uniref:hypothetical protein n=1 Tax=Aestuariivirga sp. TaxID=2650926 RepID=UPI0037851A85
MSNELLLPLLAVTIFAAISVSATTLGGGGRTAVALVYPPWWSAEQSFLAAAEGGPILAPGGLPNIILVPVDSHPAKTHGEWLRFNVSARLGCSSAQGEGI